MTEVDVNDRPAAGHVVAADQVPARGRVFIPLILISALTLLTMGRSCGHEFTTWDDPINVARNPDFNPPTLAGVARHWHEPVFEMYMPMAYTVWGALADVAYSATRGLDPHVFHAFNVLLHTVNALLVFSLLRRLLGKGPAESWAATAGALLFATHPIQVEAVNWVTGMKDLLWACFAMVALLGYLISVQRTPVAAAGVGKVSRWGPYAVGTVALVLALLSKPTAVVTPLLALLVDRLGVGRPWRAVIRSVWPWVLLALPIAIVAARVSPASEGGIRSPPWLRPLVATDALAFYLGKLVYPAKLTIDYGRTPEVIIARGWIYLTWMAPAVVTLALWRFRRRVPVALAGGAIAVAAVLPVSGLVPFEFQFYSTVADRYFYFSMCGVALIVAAVLGKLKPTVWALPAALVICALMVRSVSQSGHWHDGFTLAQHAVTVNPDTPAGLANLAGLLFERGDTKKALPAARRAVERNPTSSGTRWTLGACLWSEGMTADAEAAFKEAMALDPQNPSAPASLAAVLSDQNRLNEAAALARRAVELAPSDPMFRVVLGKILLQQGQFEGAVSELTIAARSSRDPHTHTSLGIALARLGRAAEARETLRHALRLEPSFAPAQAELQWLDQAYPTNAPQ